MKKRQQHVNEVPEEVYQRLPFKRWFLPIVSLLLIFGFLLNFNIKDRLTLLITSTLKNSPACPIQYKKLNLTLFPFPTVSIDSPQIPSICFNKAGDDLLLKKITLKIHGPSFVPLGISSSLLLTAHNVEIPLSVKIGFNEIAIKTENSKLAADFLTPFIGGSYLSGTLDISMLVLLENNRLTSGDILVKSKDLLVNKQQVSGLLIPQMLLGQLLIKVSVKDKGTLNLTEVIIGAPESPIQSSLSGVIKLNDVSPLLSNLDLKGEVKFTKKFIDDFPIVDLFISGKNPTQSGFFPFVVKGTLMTPSPAFL